MLGSHDSHTEFLLRPTEAVQLVWSNGQFGISPVHFPASTQTALILLQCHRVQFTQVLDASAQRQIKEKKKKTWKD